MYEFGEFGLRDKRVVCIVGSSIDIGSGWDGWISGRVGFFIIWVFFGVFGFFVNFWGVFYFFGYVVLGFFENHVVVALSPYSLFEEFK